jgi:hypothetical protein
MGWPHIVTLDDTVASSLDLIKCVRFIVAMFYLHWLSNPIVYWHGAVK